jgi:hypothetical protein
MTITRTDTFNRDDIRRVYASFAAEYRIVAEWTKLHSRDYVARTIAEIGAVAEEQYLKEVHLQLRSSTGAIRQAAVYRVSTDASGWSADRPGDLYWDVVSGDYLQVIMYYSQEWFDLSEAARDAFRAKYLPGWGPSNFNGSYAQLSPSVDRHYNSRAYGIERTRYS